MSRYKSKDNSTDDPSLEFRYSLLYRNSVPNEDQATYVRKTISKRGYFDNTDLRWYLISQNGIFHKTWDVLIILLVLYSTFMVPLEVGMQYTVPVPNWNYFDYSVDFIFFIDIIISFFTPVSKERGYLETDLKIIAKKYLFGRLLLDLVATFPFELLAANIPSISSEFTLFQFFKLPRLLRVARLFKYLEKFKYAKVMRIVKLFIIYFIIAHIIGCFEFYFEVQDDVPDATFLERYLYYLNLGAYLMIGKVVQIDSDSQRIYSVVVISIIQCVNAAIFSTIAILIQEFDAAKSIYMDKMDLINEHLYYLELEPSLQEQVRNFYEYLSIRTRDLVYGEKLLIDLSQGLGKKVNSNIYIPSALALLSSDPLSFPFIERLLSKLKTKIVMPNELLIEEGEKATECYFLVSGWMNVYIHGNWIRILKDGSFFGTIGLLLKSEKRTATIISRMFCHCFVLNREDFILLLIDYPNDAVKIQKEAKTLFFSNLEIMEHKQRELLHRDTDGVHVGTNLWKDFSGAELMRNWRERRDNAHTDRRRDYTGSAAAKNANLVLNTMLENSTAKLQSRLYRIKLKDD